MSSCHGVGRGLALRADHLPVPWTLYVVPLESSSFYELPTCSRVRCSAKLPKRSFAQGRAP
eukprot:8877080-Alexandrium_andersonii.AAC.1